MTQTRTTEKKRSAKAGKKAVDAKAKKALARAEKSVQKARKAVRDSSKKLREKAAELAKKTEKLGSKHAKAAGELRSAEAGAKKTSPDTAILTPPLPTPEPAAPTLVELRHRAKERGIAGYSRMNKAALVSALDTDAPE